jgi:hypothetical protein
MHNKLDPKNQSPEEAKSQAIRRLFVIRRFVAVADEYKNASCLFRLLDF